MSASNTIRGKAFEYATLIAFRDALKRDGVAVWVEEHDAYMTAKRAFEKSILLGGGVISEQAV